VRLSTAIVGREPYDAGRHLGLRRRHRELVEHDSYRRVDRVEVADRPAPRLRRARRVTDGRTGALEHRGPVATTGVVTSPAAAPGKRDERPDDADDDCRHETCTCAHGVKC
jgi:hypothetical protein